MATLLEMEARIAALEGATIEVNDLPIAQLLRKIEQLGLDSSALPAALVGTGGVAIEVRFGTVQLTWAGAATLSNVVTVNHGLGKTPGGVLVTPGGVGSGAGFSGMAGNRTDTTFQAQGWATGAVAATFTGFWIAIG